MKKISAKFDGGALNESKAHQIWLHSRRAGDAEKRELAFFNFMEVLLQRREMKCTQPISETA
jgi:hypothetical protein